VTHLSSSGLIAERPTAARGIVQANTNIIAPIWLDAVQESVKLLRWFFIYFVQRYKE